MDDEEEYEEFTIFISHGRSNLWKDVERYVEKELEFPVIVLSEEVNRGRTIVEKLEQEIEACHFARIIMTADDIQVDETIRARQNVVHEIGYCQGYLGRENVLVLRQDSVSEFSNISGIVYEQFNGENIKTTFPRIAKEIESALEDFCSDHDE
jgi:predicted nucleotide-binding protein